MTTTKDQSVEKQAAESSGSKNKLLVAGILMLGLIMALVFFWWQRGAKQEFSYVHEKAAELNFDRDQIIKFVKEEVSPESYSGASRGALGTLWGNAGNQEDRARLLKALLEEAGLKCDLVGGKTGYGVRLLETRDVIGIDTKPSGDWSSVEDEQDFVIRFSGANAKKEFKGRVENFLREPLRVSANGNQARLVGRYGETLWQGSYDPAEGFSVHVTFLGETPARIWRELVPEGSDQNARSEHVIVLAPCEIDKATFEKQAELVSSEFSDTPGAVEAYQLALSHWFQSDKSLADLKEFYQADAWYTVPRVLVGSSYFTDDGTEPAVYALDLRKNDVHIDAADDVTLAFALTRSSIEADIEARVLSEATGRRGRSSIDVMLAQLGEWAPSSAKRISDYEKTLSGFVRDTHPGSVLTFSAGEDLEVYLTQLKREKAVTIRLSDALQTRLEEISELPWELMKSGKVTSGQFAAFSLELETLLGAASEMGFDYQPRVKLGHSPALVKSPHVRRFQHQYDTHKKESRVSFEQQITSVREDGSYSYEVIDYYDEIGKTWQNRPYSYDVPANTYFKGNGISQWHNSQTIEKGCNPFALGLKAYKELKEKGSTEMVAYLHDNKPTEPLRIYLTHEEEFPLTINQEKINVPALFLAGRPVSEDQDKPKWETVELMNDPATSSQDGFNRFIVLDDPEFPLIVRYTEFFQASFSGSVMAVGSDTPVEDALIKVTQAGVSARSWPTGDFVLPIIKKPFAEFTVTVSHPNFETWSETLDFRLLKTFTKLKDIRLTPRPIKNQFVWIEPESLEQGLAKVADKRMARFVRQSLTDNSNLQALVPLKNVAYGSGTDKAWLLVDRNSGHITTVSSDGLHGATDRLPGNATRGLQEGAVSAYSGYIASWYAYSGGKIDAITEAMRGGDFSDLGHEHAKAFALRFLMRMMEATDNVFAGQAGVNQSAYKAGFLKGLEFFDNNPAYRGE